MAKSLLSKKGSVECNVIAESILWISSFSKAQLSSNTGFGGLIEESGLCCKSDFLISH